MKAILLLFDSLNRHCLEPYGCDWTHTPNFRRLAERSVRFDRCYAGSLPCMPARRELHTGRYNFLHRSWGPVEPYDDSMPELLKKNGVYTHLISDHQHYWEDGGATYHTRYSSWECVRGQEGDNWQPLVDALRAGKHFYSTGEILLEKQDMKDGSCDATFSWTYPLAYVQLVYSDGENVKTMEISTSDSVNYGKKDFHFDFPAGMKWARVLATDIAGNSAFGMPVFLRK